jgi:hypothetical protein
MFFDKSYDMSRDENNVMDFVKKIKKEKMAIQKILNCPFFKLFFPILRKLLYVFRDNLPQFLCGIFKFPYFI